MKDFAHSTGTFKLWEGDEVRRRALLAALIPIIQDCTKAAFLCTVERKAFSAVNADYDLDNYYGNEYALCALVCVQHVQRWIIDQGIYEAAENIFEAGDRRGNLINLMHELSYSEPVFRSPRDTVNDQGVFVPGIVALQASDWLAYEVRGAYDKLGENEAAPYRKSLRELARITAHKGSQSIITEEALRGICTKLNLPHR